MLQLFATGAEYAVHPGNATQNQMQIRYAEMLQQSRFVAPLMLLAQRSNLGSCVAENIMVLSLRDVATLLTAP